MRDLALKTLLVVLLVLAGLFVYTKFGPAIPINSVTTQKQDSFMVSGEGKVAASPNLAIVNLGVQIRRNTVKDSQDEANRILNLITDSITKLGVSKSDIRTTSYNIYPEIDFSQGGNQRVLGYNVNSDLEVKVKDFNKINSVIDEATKAGSNQVGGLRFTFDDDLRKDLENQARELAVANAKQKAQSLSRISGITLGRLINVQESTPQAPGPVFNTLEANGRGAADAVQTNVQPGEGELILHITLTYETR